MNWHQEGFKVCYRICSLLITGKNEKKSRFLTCPRHKIYMVEAVGLSLLYLKNYDVCEYVKFWVISWKFDILLTTSISKFEIWKSLCILCDTYNCDYLPHTIIFRVYSINFRLNTDFPSQFCGVFLLLFCFVLFFYRQHGKSPSVTQRSTSQENAFKKSKNLSPPFFSQNYMLKDSEVWIKGNSTLWPMGKMHSVWPLKGVLHPRLVFGL